MKEKAKRVLLIVLLTVISFSGTCFERDTRVSISQSSNPPTFVLSGNGFLQDFIISGPFSNLEETNQPVKGEGRVAWKLHSKEHRRVYELSPIAYGNVPVWATQTIPEQGAPKPLEEGKIYLAWGRLEEANFRVFCFTMKTGQVIKVDCRDR